MIAVSAVGDSELRSALEARLGRGVQRLTRRASRYATSATLDELDVQLDDGGMLELVLKDMSPDALLDGARRTKPRFLYDPVREIQTYRTLLADADLGTAACYAAMADEPGQRYWLLLERVDGIELYQVGELERWQHAAARLAVLHERLTPLMDALPSELAPPLLVHDRTYQMQWLQRACRFAPRNAGLVHLASRFEQVLERLDIIPRVVIHGELYASNVLIGDAGDGDRVCPVDWEMAAVGPALMDLAALVSGAWTDQERAAIALSYRSALPLRGGWPPDPEGFLNALDVCRLQVCVQWLGWAPQWRPPPENAHDWLGEALALTERLGL